MYRLGASPAARQRRHAVVARLDPRPARPALLTLAVLVASLALGACASTVADADSDAPEVRSVPGRGLPQPATYGQALGLWRSLEEVNAWIGARFEYDRPRALQLSETQRINNASLPIHPPETFFADPRGVCVDLARFAVDALRAIAPDLKPTYVMIEFDPLLLAGNVVRRHWVASFRRDGMLYFFADSKRPGHIAGPYAATSEYVADYAQYRRRQILGFRELPSYQRQMKTRAPRQTRDHGS